MVLGGERWSDREEGGQIVKDAQLERDVAAAEARLDRVDRSNGHRPPDDVPVYVLDHDDDLHVEEVWDGLTEDEQEELGGGPDSEVANAIDVFNELFNARDLDALLELAAEDCEAPGLGNDLDNLPEALEDLWDRRPSCLLTRGEHEGRCLSVMWEAGNNVGEWHRIATVYFDDIANGELGVIEFADDAAVLDQVVTAGPDGEHDEGSLWSEWEDGVLDG